MAKPHTPSELTEQMFATVGRAITEWSFVEKDLSELLGICLGGATIDKRHGYVIAPNIWHAMWMFYAVENWRGKLQLLDAAIEAHLNRSSVEQELKSEWATLSDKANKLARKRNKLAHWFVLPAQHTGTGGTHEPIEPARLMPPYGSPKYYAETGLNPSGLALTEIQVRRLDTAFHLLSKKIRAFMHKVASVEELRDRDARRAIDRLIQDGRLDPSLREGPEPA